MLKTLKSIFKKEQESKKTDKKESKKSAKQIKKEVKGKKEKRDESKEGKKISEAKNFKNSKEEPISEKNEKEWPNKVKAIVIIELMGAPETHIKNTMELYLERIKQNEKMIVENEDISDIEKKDSFFLQFGELTITFKSVKNLIEFCFDYMPSSVEIIEPEKITYNANDLSSILNDLQAKLHQLDMVVKNLRAENKVLNENGNLLLRNLILVALREERTFDETAKITGINKEALTNYLEDYTRNGLVEKKQDKYKIKDGALKKVQ
jgi:hypothetical protein